MDGAAVSLYLIHHIQGKDHRNIELHQLHREIQIPLDVRSIYDVDDTRGMLIQNKLPGDNLFACIGRKGIDPGKIRDTRIRMIPDWPALLVHRNPGKISHVLVRPGQLIEQCRLAAVLVPGQRKGQGSVSRKRMLPSLHMVLASLSESRVLISALLFPPSLCLVIRGYRAIHRYQIDLLCIRKPDCQLIPVNLHLHRIAHRRVLHQRDLCIRNQSHIQKMLPKRTFTSNSGDPPGFADLQISQCLSLFFFYACLISFCCHTNSRSSPVNVSLSLLL